MPVYINGKPIEKGMEYAVESKLEQYGLKPPQLDTTMLTKLSEYTLDIRQAVGVLSIQQNEMENRAEINFYENHINQFLSSVIFGDQSQP